MKLFIRAMTIVIGFSIWVGVAIAQQGTTPDSGSKAPLVGTVRYVSPSGSDFNSGTFDLPFRTIQSGVNSSASGDTVFLFDGTYYGPGNRDVQLPNGSLHIGSVSGDRTSCVVDCGGYDGFVFQGHAGLSNPMISISGMTVKNADTAMIMEGHQAPLQGPEDVGLRVRNCLIENGIRGVSIEFCESAFESAVIYNNSGTAISAERSGVTMWDCQVRSNGGGISVVDYNNRPHGMTNVDIVENGSGYSLYSDFGSVTFSSCRVDSNSGNGIYYSESEIGDLRVEDSSVCYNDGDGITAWMFVSLTIEGCQVIGNNGDGVTWDTASQGTSLTGLEASGNQGYGIDGVQNGSPPWSLPLVMSQCLVTDNGLGGVRASIESSDLEIMETTIAGNSGPGLDVLEGGLKLTKVLISGNTGPGTSIDPGVVIDLVLCSNFSGNGGGDWIGPMAGLELLDGNQDILPLFCDPDNSDYHLSSMSACAVENNPDCGDIGALGIGCGSVMDKCVVLQDYDPVTRAPIEERVGEEIAVQGRVYVAPANFSPSSGGYLVDETGGINFWSSPAVTEIQEGDLVQLNGPLWFEAGELYVGTYTYFRLDSNLPVDPVFMSISGILEDCDHVGMFLRTSGVVTAIGTDSFWITDGTNDIEILISSYAGLTTAGLTVGDGGWVQGPCTILDGDMNIKPRRSSDMGFADVTGLPEPVVKDVVLHAAFPNPFNPSTTIAFEAPVGQSIRLAIYDLEGSLVKLLVDEAMGGAGFMEVVWNGRDFEGRAVSSGVYFYRLEAGEGPKTKRMALVK